MDVHCQYFHLQFWGDLMSRDHRGIIDLSAGIQTTLLGTSVKWRMTGMDLSLDLTETNQTHKQYEKSVIKDKIRAWEKKVKCMSYSLGWGSSGN